MGCGSSSGGGTVQDLTADDKEKIRSSWAAFCDGDIVDNGSYLYYRLFAKYPDAKALFKFTKDQEVTSEEFKKSKQFRSHVKRVFDVIGDLVGKMDDLTGVADDLRSLGESHYKHGVTVKQYAYVGSCLMEALEHKIGKKEFGPAKKSWLKLYSVIEVGMKAGMEEESRRSQQQTAN